MKQIFLSFPVTGLDSDKVKSIALKAELLAKDLGFLPINPFKIVPSELSTDKDMVADWERAMIILSDHIYKAKAILIVDIPERLNSQGALIEESIAKIRNYDIYYTNKDVTKIEKHIKGVWFKNNNCDQRDPICVDSHQNINH